MTILGKLKASEIKSRALKLLEVHLPCYSATKIFHYSPIFRTLGYGIA
jgi:hypothetical protein